MGHKQLLRKKKRLRKAMHRHGACKVCAPMLAHEAKGEQSARLNCPSCGREILFDFEDAIALDALLSCLSSTGDVCVAGYRATQDGQVKREHPCDCDKAHLEFRFGCGQ